MKPEILLTACTTAFTKARGTLLDAAMLLYQVRETEAWKGKHESFTDYVQEGCQINRTQASRLLTTYKHFVIDGGYDVSKLTGIDAEKLYLSMNTKGSLDQQFSRALTLSRGELKAEAAVQEDGSEHVHEPISICKVCGIRL